MSRIDTTMAPSAAVPSSAKPIAERTATMILARCPAMASAAPASASRPNRGRTSNASLTTVATMPMLTTAHVTSYGGSVMVGYGHAVAMKP